ncbi:UDP-N-acetylmuramate--L-alanine ligase [Candidatus Peregrinibacteria bacterium]|nr:MAG: UDP-N-acetylmuramate--L-alanine ligase [Candidatus Peregrinibacteria bacterium]
MFTNKTHIHFIGLGGIGVSAMAYWALENGKTVSGSDAVQSAITDNLAKQGAQVAIGSDKTNLPAGVDLVVYTEAIDRSTHPEFLAATARAIPTLSYFEALGALSKAYRTVAVVGTHGKTTTTAMIGLAAIELGLDPTVFVGSKVREFGQKNFRAGGSPWLIVEACEYRESFLHLRPYGLILLNCEAEHLDYYQTEARYREGFKRLVDQVDPDGFVIANAADPNVVDVLSDYQGAIEWVSEADVKHALSLNVLGQFNQWNAHMARKALRRLGGEDERIKTALSHFSGTWRRMEYKGRVNGAIVLDDYGHHPTEIRATLGAIRAHYPDQRLICVFQGHQYSRTHQLLDLFVDSFRDADLVWITDLYEVRDSALDREKIDGERFAKAIAAVHPQVRYSGSLEQTYDALLPVLSPNDVVVIMGAGTIGLLAERLTEG